MPAFTHLAGTDRAAVVDHLAALTPAERRLRFGSGEVDPLWIEGMADHLLRQSGNFGRWDKPRRRLLVLGVYKPATDPSVAEFAISAVPDAVDDAVVQTAHWLLPQLVARGYRRVQAFFFADGEVVQVLARQLGLSCIAIRGEARVGIDLLVTAPAMDSWLRGLAQLLSVVRQAEGVGQAARR